MLLPCFGSRFPGSPKLFCSLVVGFWFSTKVWLMSCLVVFLLSLLTFVSANSQSVDSCNSSLSINGLLPFSAASFNCNSVWSSHSFILRYSQTAKSQWSFVLSAPNSNNYIAMGFSSNGMMIGSNAIVGWVGQDGTPMMKTYFLGGQTPNQVVPKSGNLQVGNSSAVIETSTIYLAFQLNTDTPETRLIYAVGPQKVFPSAPNFLLPQHVDQVSTSINYATGETVTKGDTTYPSLKRSHGVLNMVGWGIFMPIGALVARYMKHRDPIWFYAHITIQTLGFLLGAIGVICGFVLNNNLNNNVNRHKAIGIIVLFFGCLQVIAFLVRAGKESKVRKYWNWYHYGLGRILIFLAAVNVFYGIRLGHAGKGWNAGFAILIILFFILSLILELRLSKRR